MEERKEERNIGLVFCSFLSRHQLSFSPHHSMGHTHMQGARTHTHTHAQASDRALSDCVMMVLQYTDCFLLKVLLVKSSQSTLLLISLDIPSK